MLKSQSIEMRLFPLDKKNHFSEGLPLLFRLKFVMQILRQCLVNVLKQRSLLKITDEIEKIEVDKASISTWKDQYYSRTIITPQSCAHRSSLFHIDKFRCGSKRKNSVHFRPNLETMKMNNHVSYGRFREDHKIKRKIR